MDCAGLFSGIGGFEKGFEENGFNTALLCDIDDDAKRVLFDQFPQATVVSDIQDLSDISNPDIVLAGFPCQDLSQAGRTDGIMGTKSGIVEELFRLVKHSKQKPTWIILENVPFMLNLNKGFAMKLLISRLENLGYKWAYRIIDSHSFGTPQRRRRVFLVASTSENPREVLLSEDFKKEQIHHEEAKMFGFYWSEGNTGIGWAIESIPPLKVSSGINIPTPPAIWDRANHIFATPNINDAERLMGFPVDWTLKGGGNGKRLKLLGNSVSTTVTSWIAEKILNPIPHKELRGDMMSHLEKWPKAAWGESGKVFISKVGECPRNINAIKLSQFLDYELKPLSARASLGFLKRARNSKLRFQEGFLEDLDQYIANL